MFFINFQWDLPVPIHSALQKIPSIHHRNLISVFVAKAEELTITKVWSY